MREMRFVAIATILAGALSSCAQKRDLALTQWGTPCADYGLSAQECHARYAGYADYLAQPSSRKPAAKVKAVP